MKQSLLSYLVSYLLTYLLSSLSSLVRNIRHGISTFNARMGQVLHGSLSAQRFENGITFSRSNLTRCTLVVALLLGSVNVWGADVTYIYKEATGNPGNGGEWYSGTIDSYTTWEATKGGDNAPKYYDTDTGLRVYSGGTFTITSSKTIQAITLTFSASGYTFSSDNKTTPQTVNPNATSYTWSVSRTCRLQKVEITYAAVSTTPYYVSWEADGTYLSSASGDVTEGSKPTLPSTPSDCSNGKKFIGWIDSELSNDIEKNKAKIFNSAADADPITKVTHFVAVYATATTTNGTTVTESKVDILNQTLTGITGTSYTEWSNKKSISSAVYAGKCAGSHQSIQLNNTSPNGIVSTTSGGKIRSISVEWNTNTKDGRYIDIYGNTSAYTSSSNLHSTTAATQGTKLGSIKKGTSTELTVTGDYDYIGIRANDALYLTSISITWETTTDNASTTEYSDYTTSCSGSVTPTKPVVPTIAPVRGTYNETKSITITHATLQDAILYTINDEDMNNGEVYENALSLPTDAASECNYTYTVRAFAMGDENSDVASQTYYFRTAKPTITVTDVEGGKEIEITCTTSKADIVYTTDGTDPTLLSDIYEGSFTVTTDCTIKAMATAINFDDSEVVEQEVEISEPSTDWELVTDVSMLKEGDLVVIAYNEGGKTAGAYQSSNHYFSSDASTFSDDKLKITALGASTTIFKLAGSADAWTLADYNTGKLLAANKSKHLAWWEDLAQKDTYKNTWTISVADNNTTLQNAGLSETEISSYGYIQYHPDATPTRFKTYASDFSLGKPVQLYRRRISTPEHMIRTVVSPEGKGTITAPTRANETLVVTIKAEPAAGYTFAGWEIVNTDGTTEGVPTLSSLYTPTATFTMGTADVTVTANFVEGEWELVTDEFFLQAGDKVVIADNSDDYPAVACEKLTTLLRSSKAQFSADKSTITMLPASAQILTLSATDDNRWTFSNDNGTLSASSTDENTLHFDVANAMTKWEISVTSGEPYMTIIQAIEGSVTRQILHKHLTDNFIARPSKDGYHDVHLYYKKTNSPRIVVDKYSLSGFSHVEGRGPSAAKSFTVQGRNLDDDASIRVSASAGWEVSVTEDGTYSSSITFTPTDGAVEATVWVRLNGGNGNDGAQTGSVKLTCTDAVPRVVSLSGEVTPTHEAIWMSEGEQYATEYVIDGEQAHIPSDPTPYGNCVGKVFVGWSATNIVDNEGNPASTDTRPSDLFTTTAPTINKDMVYYAVFANVDGEESAEYKLVTSLSALKEGDAYLGSYIKFDGESRYYYVKTPTISDNKMGMISTTLSSDNILSPETTAENVLFVSTGVSNQYYIKNTSGQYLYSNTAEKLSWSETACAWTFSNIASTGIVKATSSLNSSVRLGAYASSKTNGYIRTPKTTNSSDINICIFMGSGGPENYSAYSTSCPCDGPETPLAIAGETSGTLPSDGSAFTKTFAIVGGTGNGNEAIKWEVEQYETASIDRETGEFSTTTPGYYNITAMQGRKGEYCKQVATFQFEVKAPNEQYTVTFIDNGKTLATKTVNWGSTVTPPTSPASCPESMFVGWTTSDDINNFTLFSFTTPIHSNITLRAVYDIGACEDTYTRITSTPTEYDAEYVLASPDGKYGMIGVLANGQMTVVPIDNADLSTITEPVEDLVWQITKHEGTDYYRVFNRNMHKYLSIAADGSISLGSTPADVYLVFSDTYGELTIYNTSRTYAITWGSSYSRPLSTQDTYDEDTKTYYIATWGFYLYERDCEDAQYTFTSTCCANNPTNVVATATATTITISWDCPVDNANLKIYTNDGVEIEDKAVTNKTGFTHTFTGLTKNTDYFIRIWGVDGETVCAGELTHVLTTDATVDIVDWGTYAGADNTLAKDDPTNKTGVTLNLSDPDADATVSVGSETIITEGGERAAATELFFSKYYESTGDLKMIGIYNGTNAAIDLTGYVIYITVQNEFLNLDGQDHTLVLTDYVSSIPAGAEYIFYSTGTEMDQLTSDGETLKDCIKFTIQDKLGNTNGLRQDTWFETEECVWSGRQSLALFKGDKMIDIIGSHTGSANQEDWSGVKADNSRQLDLTDNWDILKTNFPDYAGAAFYGDKEGFAAVGKSYETQDDIILSTNRCLLIRQNTVTSGENAVLSNYKDQGFATLGTEWEGKNISVGGNNTDPTTITNVCSSFSEICSFDYTEYYVTYTPLTLGGSQLSGMLNSDGTYTIPFDVDNLACKRIKIEATKDGEVLFSSQVRVPIIVDGDEATDGETFAALGEIHKVDEPLTTAEIAAICKTCDVVVKGGEVTLTHAGQTNYPQINDLYVYPGAKVNVTKGVYNVNSVILRSQEDVMPHLILPNNTTGIATAMKTMRFTKRIPRDRYFFFSLPFDCEISQISFSDGNVGTRGVDWEILYYDGASREENGSGQSNWFPVTDEFLYAGQGYALAVETPAGTKKEMVFPMTHTNTALHALDNDNKSVVVTAHGYDETNDLVSGKTPNHLGWNFVGNPYFTTYSQGNISGEYLKEGKLELNAENEYEWNEDGFLYLTIPDAGQDQTYTQTEASVVNLPPFYAFFVQADKHGWLDYTPGAVDRSLLAPRYKSSADDEPVFVGISLSNGQKTDETSLVINNRYTQEYEIGADLEKMIGFADKPQLYVKDANYRYAFKALNETDASNANMVGVYLPAREETTYTFDVMRNYDLSRVQGVYLTDHKMGKVTNLLQETYVFTNGYSYTNTRFSLSVVLAPKAVTSLTDIDAGWSVWQDAGLHISLQGLTAGDDVRVIDATGRLVDQQTATETTAAFELPAAGAYCVQTTGKNGMQVKKIVVR